MLGNFSFAILQVRGGRGRGSTDRGARPTHSASDLDYEDDDEAEAIWVNEVAFRRAIADGRRTTSGRRV
jgi:hypothetical protein